MTRQTPCRELTVLSCTPRSDPTLEDLDAIRRDLASPFQSAARTTRKTADE